MREIGVSRRTKFPVEGHTSPSPASPKLGHWLASLAGSQASYAQADGLLRELSGLNFGAKRIEWTTRTVGDDPEAWRAKGEASGSSLVGGGSDSVELGAELSSWITEEKSW